MESCKSANLPLHIEQAYREQCVIGMVQRHEVFQHDLDDCGQVSTRIKDIEIHMYDMSEPRLPTAYTEHTGDAFLSVQIGQGELSALRPFCAQLAQVFHGSKLTLRKGDTTFCSAAHHFAVLGVGIEKGDWTLGPVAAALGSVDTYVLGRHFRQTQDARLSGFCAACAAISDIGACGGLPGFLKFQVINPLDAAYLCAFTKGVRDAAEMVGIADIHCAAPVQNAAFGEMTVTFFVLGRVPIGKRCWPLRGLQEGMQISVAGRLGGAAAGDYDVPVELLRGNLDPTLRGQLIEAISGPTLASDVSDGLRRSLDNIGSYAPELMIEIDQDALLKTAYSSEVTMDHIFYGGDDYALVLATFDELNIAGVQRIGEVKRVVS